MGQPPSLKTSGDWCSGPSCWKQSNFGVGGSMKSPSAHLEVEAAQASNSLDLLYFQQGAQQNCKWRWIYAAEQTQHISKMFPPVRLPILRTGCEVLGHQTSSKALPWGELCGTTHQGYMCTASQQLNIPWQLKLNLYNGCISFISCTSERHTRTRHSSVCFWNTILTPHLHKNTRPI